MSWLDRLAEIRDRDWSEAEPDERLAKAREVVQFSSYAASAAAVVPVPMAELALLLPIHTAMVMTIGHVFGRPIPRTEAARVAVELGAIAGLTLASTAALSALRKLFLPGIGSVLAAPASFALTYGLGRVAIEYFETPGLSRERLRTVFKEAMAEGRKVFSKERLDEFRDRYGEGRDVVDEAEPVEAEPVDSAPVEPTPTPGSAAEVETDEGVEEPPRSGRRRRNL